MLNFENGRRVCRAKCMFRLGLIGAYVSSVCMDIWFTSVKATRQRVQYPVGLDRLGRKVGWEPLVTTPTLTLDITISRYLRYN
jgi:hypothetical protein